MPEFRGRAHHVVLTSSSGEELGPRRRPGGSPPGLGDLAVGDGGRDCVVLRLVVGPLGAAAATDADEPSTDGRRSRASAEGRRRRTTPTAASADPRALASTNCAEATGTAGAAPPAAAPEPGGKHAIGTAPPNCAPTAVGGADLRRHQRRRRQQHRCRVVPGIPATGIPACGFIVIDIGCYCDGIGCASAEDGGHRRLRVHAGHRRRRIHRDAS